MKNNMVYGFFDAPIGRLTICADDAHITGLYFGEVITENVVPGDTNGLIKRACDELREYFDGKRKAFDLPLKPEGTDFQKAVWSALCMVPYGETRSYKDIALAVGNEKATRAVGMANNKNPISIIIPCHRIIGSGGKLVGYGGGLDIKEKLLDLEREHK